MIDLPEIGQLRVIESTDPEMNMAHRVRVVNLRSDQYELNRVYDKLTTYRELHTNSLTRIDIALMSELLKPVIREKGFWLMMLVVLRLQDQEMGVSVATLTPEVVSIRDHFEEAARGMETNRLGIDGVTSLAATNPLFRQVLQIMDMLEFSMFDDALGYLEVNAANWSSL